jgi:hypothetical protein
MQLRNLPIPIKGNSDWRSYRAFQLPNGIPVLLVNDSVSKRTSIGTYVPRSLTYASSLAREEVTLSS